MLRKTSTPSDYPIREIPTLAVGIFVLSGMIGFFQMVAERVVNSDIEHLCNDGIAFGILLPEYVFTVLWIFVMVVVCFLLWHDRVSPWAYILIIAGGISNLVDRLIYECVVDYISLVPWNTFNLADVSIFVGAVLIVWQTRKQTQSLSKSS